LLPWNAKFGKAAGEDIGERLLKGRSSRSNQARQVRQGPALDAANIRFVQIDLGVADKDHFLAPEEKFRIAIAMQ
jgi:hypothetical protein